MRKRSRLFQTVSSRNPARSVFDLSYSKKFDGDMGILYPVMCDEVVPGDIFKIGNQALIRFAPMVAPVMHEIDCIVHYFFVPYRILWDDWEDFITSGEDGTDTSTLNRWTPTSYGVGSLWDYLGFPPTIIPLSALPLTFPRDAYNLIWNEFYRDETIQTAVALTAENLLYRNWEKDYFTSALLSQQKGTAPALPISGTTSAVFNTNNFLSSAGTNTLQFSDTASTAGFYVQNATGAANAEDTLNDNVVDFASASTFDVADLRLAFQIQRWMERNNRAGTRYTEFLRSHFGVSPRDDRLDRPEYIGGTRSPIIISEVLQTSETDTTPQGELAGHGINVSNGYAGTYRVEEFGLIMGLMSIMPKPSYQIGVNRQWLRTTRYDFYFPEFANLSEQAIIRAELYPTAVANENTTIFGYQGRYDEMRVKHDMCVGLMRTDFDYWHISRQFGSAPTLDDTFLKCVPRKDFLAVPAESTFFVEFGNLIKAFRPLPIQAEPGLIDH